MVRIRARRRELLNHEAQTLVWKGSSSVKVVDDGSDDLLVCWG